MVTGDRKVRIGVKAKGNVQAVKRGRVLGGLEIQTAESRSG